MNELLGFFKVFNVKLNFRMFSVFSFALVLIKGKPEVEKNETDGTESSRSSWCCYGEMEDEAMVEKKGNRKNYVTIS